MSTVVIQAERLGKRYRRGLPASRGMLRDTLARVARWPPSAGRGRVKSLRAPVHETLMHRAGIEKVVDPIIRRSLRELEYTPEDVPDADFAVHTDGMFRPDVRRVSLLVSMARSVLCTDVSGEGPSVDGAPREVPVVTIDQVCAQKNLKGSYLIKLDVQGAERTLRETEVVILEVTLFGTMIGGPQLYDVVSRLKQLGFVVYDIWGHNYRPYDNALAQVDMAFVREHGRFRESHVFATPQQRAALAGNSLPGLVQMEKELR